MENEDATDQERRRSAPPKRRKAKNEMEKAGHEESRDTGKTRDAAATASDESDAEDDAYSPEPAERRLVDQWSVELAQTVPPGPASS